MASIPGGAADKLGNEFERLWTVRHLFDVLAGRAVSVQIESLGDDERGTEFWMRRTEAEGGGGTREAHQCKRENGSKGDWTIADLAAKRILDNAKSQLKRDPSHRFVFVSADKAPTLADLVQRAGRGDGPEAFYRHAITTSSGLKTAFSDLCRRWALDPEKPDELAQAHGHLRRLDVRLENKSTVRAAVEDLAAALVEGNPTDVVASLETLVSRNESFGQHIREPQIIAALPRGTRPRDLRQDRTLATRLAATSAMSLVQRSIWIANCAERVTSSATLALLMTAPVPGHNKGLLANRGAPNLSLIGAGLVGVPTRCRREFHER